MRSNSLKNEDNKALLFEGVPELATSLWARSIPPPTFRFQGQAWLPRCVLEHLDLSASVNSREITKRKYKNSGLSLTWNFLDLHPNGKEILHITL